MAEVVRLRIRQHLPTSGWMQAFAALPAHACQACRRAPAADLDIAPLVPTPQSYFMCNGIGLIAFSFLSIAFLLAVRKAPRTRCCPAGFLPPLPLGMSRSLLLLASSRSACAHRCDASAWPRSPAVVHREQPAVRAPAASSMHVQPPSSPLRPADRTAADPDRGPGPLLGLREVSGHVEQGRLRAVGGAVPAVEPANRQRVLGGRREPQPGEGCPGARPTRSHQKSAPSRPPWSARAGGRGKLLSAVAVAQTICSESARTACSPLRPPHPSPGGPRAQHNSHPARPVHPGRAEGPKRPLLRGAPRRPLACP